MDASIAMNHMPPGRIRPLVDDDLAMILAWRNHPDVRRHMFNSDAIAPTEHHEWFERASRDPGKHLLVFEADGLPRGFVQFSRSGGDPVADWGFYAAPGAPAGTGRLLGRAALEYAFGHLGLHKVCGQVLAGNERSISLHRALGFRQEGLLREQHYDGTTYHDVLCFGLLQSEWEPTP